jgi:hypothetical protein
MRKSASILAFFAPYLLPSRTKPDATKLGAKFPTLEYNTVTDHLEDSNMTIAEFLPMMRRVGRQ